MSENLISLDQSVNLLRAAGETTRLRLLALLSEADLTVSDLIEILGQSQPRISRHLKLLTEAGLLERHQEGAWAYFRLADQGVGSGLVNAILAECSPEDVNLTRDRERLDSVRRKRAMRAAEYFSQNANDWDTIRSLHVDEEQVEKTMLKMVGSEKFSAMLDLGTGTGRILELFSGLYEKGVGIDASRDMLAVARSRLDAVNLSRVQTRQGDLYILPTQANSYDLITIHQVLHYLTDPQIAIAEAAKALAAGGRLLIVDFAPHELDFLREEYAHLRLGFSDEQMKEWLDEVGLKLEQVEQLKPQSEQTRDALTVSLWLASKT
ncbi:MAG: metalloregulator ArsR/SmtB family transcription factor [Pseudomonadota bacterium]